MKIFLGSSSEQRPLMTEISEWIEAKGHKPLPWDAADTFLPGENTNIKLLQISKNVDAAVFIFSEDDTVWYRNDSHMKKARDNVVLEYGLFCGSLGFRRVAIIRCASPKMSSDLDGVTYVTYHETTKVGARVRINAWLDNLEKEEQDPAVIAYQAQQAAMKHEIDALQEDLRFARAAVTELRGIVDAELPSKSGEWTFLFERDFYRLVVRVLLETFRTPGEWRTFLDDNGLYKISVMIAWDRLNDPDRLRWFLTKSLSTIRTYDRGELFSVLMESLPADARTKIRSDSVVAALQHAARSTKPTSP